MAVEVVCVGADHTCHVVSKRDAAVASSSACDGAAQLVDGLGPSNTKLGESDATPLPSSVLL